METTTKGITLDTLEQIADDSLVDAMLLANLIKPDRRHLVSGNFLRKFYRASQGKRQLMLRKPPSEAIAHHFKDSYATIWYCALAEQLAFDFFLNVPRWLKGYQEKLSYENYGGGDDRERNEHLPANVRRRSGAMVAFAKRNIFIRENDLTRKGVYPRLRESDPNNPYEMSTYRGRKLDGDYRTDWQPRYQAYLSVQGLLVSDGAKQDVASAEVGANNGRPAVSKIDGRGVQNSKEVSSARETAHLIAAARAQNGWTQEELAERCGLKQSNISRIEAGGTSPTVATLQVLAQGLGRKLTLGFS